MWNPFRSKKQVASLKETLEDLFAWVNSAETKDANELEKSRVSDTVD